MDQSSPQHTQPAGHQPPQIAPEVVIMQQQFQAQQQQLAQQHQIIQQQQAAVTAQQPVHQSASAPAMLTGNLQTDAVPLCPLPTWCGGREKDAETMITLLDSALEANVALSIQEQPA